MSNCIHKLFAVLMVLLLSLNLTGCGIPPVLIGAGLGFGASALKLDDDILKLWVSAKGKTIVDVPQTVKK